MCQLLEILTVHQHAFIYAMTFVGVKLHYQTSTVI